MLQTYWTQPAAILPVGTEIEPSTAGLRWSDWIQWFGNYLIAMSIVNESASALSWRMSGWQLWHTCWRNKLGIYIPQLVLKNNSVHKILVIFGTRKNIVACVHVQEVWGHVIFVDADGKIKAQLILRCAWLKLHGMALREPQNQIWSAAEFWENTGKMSPTSWRHWLRGLFAVNELKHKQKSQIAFQRGHRKQNVQTTEKHNQEKGIK